MLSLQRMNSSNRTDLELLDLIKAGDRRAFATIYDRHCAVLYRTAFNILSDHDLAKDVVQETFIMLFEKVNERTIINLQAYLFQTVKYQCFMHLRSGRISEKHLHKMNLIIESQYLGGRDGCKRTSIRARSKYCNIAGKVPRSILS